jgi:glycosyltransferase involved in cell wall biosynthesis
MDIIIKSFNRPYYLERCLRSIERYVKGTYSIYILDDGTPPEYMQRIQELFPTVTIAYSPLYQQKVAALHRHVSGENTFDERTIPISFWKAQIAQRSDIFLLLEDDIWITESIDLELIEQQMHKQRLASVKLSWLGNPRLIPGQRRFLAANLEQLIPNIPLSTRLVFLNEWRVRSVLYRLKLLRFMKPDFEYQLPLYGIYTVASAFFDKAYWLYLWDDSQTVVNEPLQLMKAMQWLNKHQPKFAKTEHEVTKTSFTTSATNMFKDINLDVFCFNHYLNKAWLNGELDAMCNFPHDIPEEHLQLILEQARDPRTTYPEWLRWVAQFKKQYQSFGCEVE